MLQMEAEFSPLFTAVISNVRLDDTYARTVDVFERESQPSFWATTSLPLPGAAATV